MPDLQERARKAAVHPTVDWLYAVLLAVQQLEEALLVPPADEGAPAWRGLVPDKASLPASPPAELCTWVLVWLPALVFFLLARRGPLLRTDPLPLPCLTSRFLLQLRTAQQWRWALLRALHQDGESSQPAALAAHYEPLLFSWMRLRKAVASLLGAVADASSGESF